jgi:hypothetical protein
MHGVNVEGGDLDLSAVMKRAIEVFILVVLIFFFIIISTILVPLIVGCDFGY